jgi:hypothetical protein
MGHRSEERLSTKDREVMVQTVELEAHPVPIPRHVDIACISLRFLIAVFASDVAGDTNGEVFDSH